MDKYFHVSFGYVTIPNWVFCPQIWSHFTSHALEVGIFRCACTYNTCQHDPNPILAIYMGNMHQRFEELRVACFCLDVQVLCPSDLSMDSAYTQTSMSICELERFGNATQTDQLWMSSRIRTVIPDGIMRASNSHKT